jgi:glycosyltransferase involved in cell wall biosynthesis
MKKNKSKISILFLVNTPGAFMSHRLPLAIAAKAQGFDVHIVSGLGSEIEQIKKYGFTYHLLPLSRSGQNPFKEIITIFKLVAIFRKIKPDLVHLITLKPILYGAIAARITNIKAVVSAVAGLGTIFLGETVFARIRCWVIKNILILILSWTKSLVIFQNLDDQKSLLSPRAEKHLETRLIHGSGVDLKRYPFMPEPDDRIVVAMSSRLLKDKGVIEYIEAAKILNECGLNIEFHLIGDIDPDNPTSLSKMELEHLNQQGYINMLGYRTDIAERYAASNIICLPSYREGFPKSLIEAAACGRAVVTTDVPGCRDAIIENKTGLLVPPRNATALADAIKKLAKDQKIRNQMGASGRALAEKLFSIENVVSQHLQIYNNILKDKL